MAGTRTIFPSGYTWVSERFDTSSSIVLPPYVEGEFILFSGQASGGGGCSGGAAWSATGGTGPDDYANGGGAGQACERVRIPVTAGETLSLVIGAAGTGGAAVVRSISGTTNGNPGGAGSNLTLSRSGAVIATLRAGAGGTWASGGGGVGGGDTSAAFGVTHGGDGGDDLAVGDPMGLQIAGAEGADSGTARGGHGGGASASGSGGAGGAGDLSNAANATATAGTVGIRGSGGGAGGSALANTATGFTSTSGAGAAGGSGWCIIEYLGIRT